MVVRFRWSVVVAVILAIVLWGGGNLAPVTGSFDDDDPDNDPNACHAAAEPENCDWDRGWFQAAVNYEHITLEAARTRYPDLHKTDWLPEEEKTRRENQAREDADLLNDDDPTNDPNTCFESDEPNCDWVRGWYNAVYNTATNLSDEDEASKADRQAFLSYLEASRKADLENPIPDPDDLPPGSVLILDISWFCPLGIQECDQPPNECGPGDRYTYGECFIRR